MKHPYFIWFLLLLLLVACNSQIDTPVIATETDTLQAKISCYTSTSPKDTVLLHMRREGNNVTGSLIYSIFEKDRNTGTITGQFQGDTLFATYTFMSEGIESVRGVIFLKQGHKLIEGYGKAAEQEGKATFPDKSSLTFGSGIILTKTNCP